jgi:hypothetical protein
MNLSEEPWKTNREASATILEIKKNIPDVRKIKITIIHAKISTTIT